MLDIVVNLIFMLICFIFSFYLEKELNSEYYNEDFANKAGVGKTSMMLLPLVFPRLYFKKEKIRKGYLNNLLKLILIIGGVYFLVKILYG